MCSYNKHILVKCMTFLSDELMKNNYYNLQLYLYLSIKTYILIKPTSNAGSLLAAGLLKLPYYHNYTITIHNTTCTIYYIS